MLLHEHLKLEASQLDRLRPSPELKQFNASTPGLDVASKGAVSATATTPIVPTRRLVR